jgi:hypothetical protein
LAPTLWAVSTAAAAAAATAVTITTTPFGSPSWLPVRYKWAEKVLSGKGKHWVDVVSSKVTKYVQPKFGWERRHHLITAAATSCIGVIAIVTAATTASCSVDTANSIATIAAATTIAATTFAAATVIAALATAGTGADTAVAVAGVGCVLAR